MATALTKRSGSWGLAFEMANAGTRAAPTVGIDNMNRVTIDTGQEWAIDEKNHGAPYDITAEKIADRRMATWSPEIGVSIPMIGQLLASMFQFASQSGSGPFVQLLLPISGKNLTVGEARSVSAQGITIIQKLGQSGSRNVAGLGGIVSELSLTFGQGRAKMTPKFMFLGYDDADAGTGTFTLPPIDLRGRDFVCKFGDGTPGLMLADEISLTIKANVVPKYYNGQNNGLPYRFVCVNYTFEGKFRNPLSASVDSLRKSYLYDGGDISRDAKLYIYSRTMADYSSALANGECRFTMNADFDNVADLMEDEITEEITFTGRNDGSNVAFQFEQATTASQPWAV